MLRQQAERGGEEGRIFSSTKDPVICIATPFALFLNFYTSVLRFIETYYNSVDATEADKSMLIDPVRSIVSYGAFYRG
jgi:hypothetical protein